MECCRHFALPQCSVEQRGTGGLLLPKSPHRRYPGRDAQCGRLRSAGERQHTASSALSTPDVKSAWAAQGFDALAGTPEDFAAFYRSEVDKWRNVIVATGMSL
jgi:hypothetical protein